MGGGFSPASADESPTNEAGAPPAPASENAAPDAPPPTDAQAPADAGAPPAPASQSAADEDFLKDAQPLSYVVNGETRTFEGMTALGDKGAFITAEHLPKLQQRLSERDHYYEKDQANYKRVTQLESQANAITQLSSWPIKDQQGRDQVLTGADAIEARNVVIGRTTAALNTILQALDNPETFRSLVDVRMDEQGQVFVFPNAQVVKALTTESELAAMKAEQGARRAFASVRGQLAAPTPQPNGTPTPSGQQQVDLSLGAEQALATVEAIVQSQGIGGLTAEDKQYLATSVLPRFVRATTPEERAQFGARIVDNSFAQVMRREAEHRTQLARTAPAAQSAAQFNQRQLAAAAIGSGPQRGGPAAAAPQRRAAPSPVEETEDAKWALMERLAGKA
jgi:hypothetical protein